MALPGNSIILQNRPLTPTILPLSKLPSKSINYQSNHLHSLFHCNPKLPPLSCAAKSTFLSDDVELQSSNSTSSSTTWSEFAKNVSGEWDGFGADFTAKGIPIELPENVVPEAFREWEVRVFDWQTQCPTLASIEFENPVLNYKNIKLLPTVGCEADAATRFSIDCRNVGGTDSSISTFAFQSSGCYVAVWPIEDKNGVNWGFELEHCLINPEDKESRVRIIQVVELDNGKKTMILKNIRVFVEQWYGPFRDGDQLGGCAIRDSAFASTSAMESSQVAGVWQSSISVASFDASETGLIQELKENGVQKSVRDAHDLILLPKQLWCSLKRTEDGETNCEAGWLFDHGSAVTSKCSFSSDSKLKEISIARETPALQNG
ncbi:uncharacterized protein [Euphorbia lathyris]|uniref:uncharacterized protein n=1 Tax=Euphorbia lathyris TaxID=212925 RepID=UPI0033141B1A